MAERIFAYDKAKDIYARWLNGESMKKLANENYCHFRTIRRTFDYYGFYRSSEPGRRKSNGTNRSDYESDK